MKVPHIDADGNTVMLEPYKSLTSYISEDVWAFLIGASMFATCWHVW